MKRTTKLELSNKNICAYESAGVPRRFWNSEIENYLAETKEKNEVVVMVNEFMTSAFRESTGLILIGKPGTGKTHLACSVLKSFICAGRQCFFTTMLGLIRMIKESWRSNSEFTETQLVKRFSKYFLLVVDEIGVQFGSQAEYVFLTEIINNRYNEKRPTILIGNRTVNEMKEIIGDAAFDRFREEGMLSHLIGNLTGGNKYEIKINSN